MWKDFKKIRRVHERAKSPCIKDPLLPRRVQSTPLSASSTQHTWELLAGELHGTSPTTCAGKADQELPWSVCQLPHLGKRKIEENLIFHYSFIQCSTEKLLFSVQHFCGNIRIFCSHYGFTSFYAMWSPGNLKVPLTLAVKKKWIVLFEGLPQFKWSDLVEQDAVGQGSFGAVFMVFDSSG